jgi:hypothetical protein
MHKVTEKLVPIVGMPCTVCHPNDRYAASVTQVIGKKLSIIWIKREGWNEEEPATLRHDGNYRLRGEHGARITLGVAESYRCPDI